jgi:glycosyltransferase involved in cell wall biosynthesis
MTAQKPVMKKPPKISVVTPSYNQARYLETTLRSVLEQNYENLEYIVMDGGSTDRSVEIIQRYGEQFAYYQSQPDGGQADAIRQGFRRSSGDILMWVNSDDLLLPGALHAIERYFVDHPHVDLVVGRNLMIDEVGRIVRRIWPVRPTFARTYHWGCGFSQPASAWTRSIYERVGELDSSLHFCMDRDLYLRLLHLGRAGVIHHYLAAFRIHKAAKSSTQRSLQQKEDLIVKGKWSDIGFSKIRLQGVKWQAQLTARLVRGLGRVWPLPQEVKPWLIAMHQHSSADRVVTS